jgi:hypothetical protein
MSIQLKVNSIKHLIFMKEPIIIIVLIIIFMFKVFNLFIKVIN